MRTTTSTHATHQNEYLPVSPENIPLPIPKKTAIVEVSEPLSLTFRQILCVVPPLLGMLSVGLTVGFTGVALPQLQSPDSSIPIDQEQASWIAGMSVLSMVLGSSTSGIIMERIGRKATCMVIYCPFVIGWLMIALAPNLGLLYAGRLLTGIAVGGSGAPFQVYISEIVRPNLRGALGGSTVIGVAGGILLVHVLGTLFGWRVVAGISAAVSLCAAFVMLFFPETPTWLASRGKLDEAKKALKLLRGKHVDIINSEYTDLLKSLKGKEDTKHISSTAKIRKTLFSSLLWRPYGVMVILVFLQQFSGYNVLIFYSAQLLRNLSDAGDASGDSDSGDNHNFTEYTATVVMSSLRFVVCAIAPFLLRHFNRRTLNCGPVACHLCLSFCWLATTLQHRRNGFLCVLWIPFLLIGIYICAVSSGVMHMPWVLVGEIFPFSVRGIGSSLAVSTQFLLMFVVVKTYPALVALLGRDGVFVFYAVCSVAGTLGVFFWLPETRGRTLQDIERQFESSKEAEITREA